MKDMKINSKTVWFIIGNVFLAALIISATYIIVAAYSQPVEYKDTNHLYWKDIDVVVTDVEHKHWLSGYAHYFSTKVTVWSEEYQLQYTDTIQGKGNAWDYREGDIVQAELFTWKNNETGEINRRTINRVYG